MTPVEISNVNIKSCKFSGVNVSFGVLETLKGSQVKISEFIADSDS